MVAADRGSYGSLAGGLARDPARSSASSGLRRVVVAVSAVSAVAAMSTWSWKEGAASAPPRRAEPRAVDVAAAAEPRGGGDVRRTGSAVIGESGFVRAAEAGAYEEVVVWGRTLLIDTLLNFLYSQ